MNELLEGSVYNALNSWCTTEMYVESEKFGWN